MHKTFFFKAIHIGVTKECQHSFGIIREDDVGKEQSTSRDSDDCFSDWNQCLLLLGLAMHN